MKIGLIGYGKMGKEIFSLLFNKLIDCGFVIFDIVGLEENSQAVLKTLTKQLRRKLITNEQYEKKKNLFTFTDDFSKFKGCDIVIEAVTEDMDLKKDIFHHLSEVVSDDCLLLTNTSSLDIAEMFSGIPNIKRCFGMHFFYPVKLSGFIELNVLESTDNNDLMKAQEIIDKSGKRPIVFKNDYHIYLNQILSSMLCHGIFLKEQYKVSASEFDMSLKELFPVAGVFEVLDSIGLGLIAAGGDSFKLIRIRQLMDYGFNIMQVWIEKGCPKETGALLNFLDTIETDTGNNPNTAELDMIAFILNESVKALADYEDNTSVLKDAIKDTLGIAEDLSFYYRKYGAQNIFMALDTFYDTTGYDAYRHADKDLWDKYYNEV